MPPGSRAEVYVKPTGNRRERGAYFTPESLARAIAEWGVRSPREIVLDPAAGDGALLVAAHHRLKSIGEPNGSRFYGVELHARTHQRLTATGTRLAIPSKNLRCGDFFLLSDRLPSPDVILMNPPFVRHHDIPAKVHERMRANIREAGVQLGGRASSWAYFLLESARILKQGGRLAAVLPLDLLGASYSREILQFLDQSFERTSVSVQEEDLFDGLPLRAVLLFADEFHGGKRDPLRPQHNVGQKHGYPASRLVSQWRAPLRHTKVITKRATALLRDLAGREQLTALKDQATVGIGYVAGDSTFLHLSDGERIALGIGTEEVVPTVTRAREIEGIRFLASDWDDLRIAGARCWLFHPGAVRSACAVAYLKGAKAKLARKKAKCRARDPWWKVNLGQKPSALVVYTGTLPRFVSNSALAWASNALYVAASATRSGTDLALCSMTSVARIGMAMRGRQLGGGLRKLDVWDVQNVLLPDAPGASSSAQKVDALVRSGAINQAVGVADDTVLREGLGWSRKELIELQALCKSL